MVACFAAKMGMEAAQAMSALGPTAACLVLGLFAPAGAGHGSLFLLSEMGMEAAQAMSALGPTAACRVLGLPRRQALVMVACFAVKNGHGGCSGHVSARFHSRLSCFGAFPAGWRWSW